MLALALGLAAGIAGLHAIPELPCWQLPALAWAGALCVTLAALRVRREVGPGHGIGLLLFALAAALGFSLAWWQARALLAADWPCRRDREELTIAGRVAAPALLRDGRTEFDFDADARSRSLGVPPRLRLSWYQAEAVPWPGEAWQLQVRLRCRRSLRNPAGADRELALLADRIGATGYLSGRSPARRLDDGAHHRPVQRLRAHIAERIAALMRDSPEAGIVQGLAVGVRGKLSDEQWRVLSVSGTAHLVAISGLHVTAFALTTLALSGFVLRFGQPRWLSRRRVLVDAALLIGVAGGYTLLAGAALPALRTLAMLSVAVAFRVARREQRSTGILAASAFVLLAADPLALLQAGFWLSFVATAALVIAAPPGAGAIGGFVRAQAAVTLALAPVSVIVFGFLSVVGPVANAVAIPAFSVLLLPLTLAGVALLPVWETGAAWAFAATGWMIAKGWPLLEWLVALPAAAWRVPQPPAWLAAAALVAVLAALALRQAAIGAACLVIVVASLLRAPAVPPPGALDAIVLDVGQGLAVVLRTTHRVLVFDAGPRWRGGGSAGEAVVLPYLRAQGVRRIDMLVLSHDDADHAGGATALLAAMPVTQLLRGAGSFADGPAGTGCRRGQRWRWDGVSFEVLHPGEGESWDDNEGSCVLRVTTETASLLLVADVGRLAEDSLTARPELRGRLQADVALVGHHGSRSSSSQAWVDAVQPRWALVSAGFGNRWGMPRAEVLARWRAGGATARGTQDEGALRLRLPAAGMMAAPAGQAASERRWWHVRTEGAGGGTATAPGKV
ncbi:MAG: DNA internalization-related competence protein ComEC/Rec2 [Gammaproteobacteria bacterium]|nr:DNA internalization-related competence protein ComEC/Rec2 [Gammaproteobacteria bacterium]